MTHQLELLRRNILKPYNKYFLFDDKKTLKSIDYEAFNKDHEGSGFAIVMEKTTMLSAIQFAAAINHTLEDIRSEQRAAENKAAIANSPKP